MKLKQQMRERIRMQGKSDQTFKTYWHWCERFLRFVRDKNGKWIHPSDLGVNDVERFLTHLANHEYVSANTQNVALQSLCYLFNQVTKNPIEGVNAFRSKRPQRVRQVLDVSEVARLFENLSGVYLLAAKLMYGCGLRIGDVTGLRIKDISFERRQLHIHDGKGKKDRFTCFPSCLHDEVKRRIQTVRSFQIGDVQNGRNGVSLPHAWSRKSPSSRLNLGWYYLFCSRQYGTCPRSGEKYRHHLHRSVFSREIGKAAKRAGILKRVTSHILRHCYATHANEQGVDIKSLQALLGHTDIRTTETYLHVNKERVTAASSPLEAMQERGWKVVGVA